MATNNKGMSLTEQVLVAKSLGLDPDVVTSSDLQARIFGANATPPASGDPAPSSTSPDAPGAPETFEQIATRLGVPLDAAATLSASELAACKAAGAKPEAYAANKAIIKAAKSTKRRAVSVPATLRDDSGGTPASEFRATKG